MSYAIIEDSGSQIRASVGDELLIDLRDGADAGSVTFDKVLLVGGKGAATIGTPYVSGATVVAEVIEAMFVDDKVNVVKFRKRKGYHRKNGHRQKYMRVKVTAING